MTKDEIDIVISNISYSTGKQVFSDCDLIIEKMDVKQVFWEEVEKIARRDCYFATNTSGLIINKISELVEQKDRFIGMHFWNPPHIIPLVELIRGDSTTYETVEVLKELLIGIGKEPVVVQKDAPGFIANRLQFVAFREALYIVNQGIASIEDVDKVMKFGPGFKYPVIGPLQTADLGGLDTFYYISSYLFNELSDAKEARELLKRKMESGKLGLKSKEGFYIFLMKKVKKLQKIRTRYFLKC